MKDYLKNYYNTKHDDILENKKEYYQKNREKILEAKSVYRSQPGYGDSHRQWRAKNMDKCRELARKYRIRHPHAALWRSILYRVLGYFDTPKSGHTVDILGYSADEFKLHVESHFQPGMTWENHGEWELDHVRPISSFPPDARVHEVNALNNLRPLWSIDNRLKRDQWDFPPSAVGLSL